MNCYRTHTCGELRAENIGQEVTIAGWIHRKRNLGNLCFVDLRDHYGITQCVVDSSSDLFDKINGLRPESVVSLRGEVIKRESINKNMPTGDIELAIKAIAPNMPIIAPWREWDIKSREEEIAYAEAHNVPLKINRETNYSKDKNIWHLSHEGLDLEDPMNEPLYNKEGFLEMGVSPEMAPDKPTYVTIHFEKGVPTAIDGKDMGSVEIVEKLNELGGANGIGLLDIVENRLVGMKCRGVYETPGGAILYKAHEVLETICLDKETAHYKALVAQKLAELVYNAQWFTPLTEAILAFVKSTQQTVTGDVTLKLYKGNMINAGVKSPYSLYDPEIATFDEDEVYDQKDSAGFINLYGLPIKVMAKMKEKNGLDK